jgi:hypothetical protein
MHAKKSCAMHYAQLGKIKTSSGHGCVTGQYMLSTIVFEKKNQVDRVRTYTQVEHGGISCQK